MIPAQPCITPVLPPSSPPVPWTRQVDPKTKIPYYYNTVTRQSQWIYPYTDEMINAMRAEATSKGLQLLFDPVAGDPVLVNPAPVTQSPLPKPMPMPTDLRNAMEVEKKPD